MFYSQTFLAPLSTVGIAAHLQHRLKKSQYASAHIPSTVRSPLFFWKFVFLEKKNLLFDLKVWKFVFLSKSHLNFRLRWFFEGQCYLTRSIGLKFLHKNYYFLLKTNKIFELVGGVYDNWEPWKSFKLVISGICDLFIEFWWFCFFGCMMTVLFCCFKLVFREFCLYFAVIVVVNY
jgi:hypothetical protein